MDEESAVDSSLIAFVDDSVLTLTSDDDDDDDDEDEVGEKVDDAGEMQSALY